MTGGADLGVGAGRAPIVPALEQMLRAAEEQTRAAAAGDWAEVVRVADERDRLLPQLGDGDSALTDGERVLLSALAARVASLDREVVQALEREMRRVRGELAALGRSRAMALAYARPADAARHDLVSRRA